MLRLPRQRVFEIDSFSYFFCQTNIDKNAAIAKNVPINLEKEEPKFYSFSKERLDTYRTSKAALLIQENNRKMLKKLKVKLNLTVKKAAEVKSICMVTSCSSVSYSSK